MYLNVPNLTCKSDIIKRTRGIPYARYMVKITDIKVEAGTDDCRYVQYLSGEAGILYPDYDVTCSVGIAMFDSDIIEELINYNKQGFIDEISDRMFDQIVKCISVANEVNEIKVDMSKEYSPAGTYSIEDFCCESSKFDSNISFTLPTAVPVNATITIPKRKYGICNACGKKCCVIKSSKSTVLEICNSFTMNVNWDNELLAEFLRTLHIEHPKYKSFLEELLVLMEKYEYLYRMQIYEILSIFNRQNRVKSARN